METVKFALSIVEVIASIFLIVTILLQPSKQQGLGAIEGGADTFFGTTKARGIDAVLAKISTVVAIAFVVIAIALNIL